MSYSACPALALNGIVFCSFERFRVVWTGEHDSNTIRVDGRNGDKFAVYKNIRTCKAETPNDV